MANGSPGPIANLLLAILSIYWYCRAIHSGQDVAPFISTQPSAQTSENMLF